MKNHPKFWAVIADGEHARVVIPGRAAGMFRTQSELHSATAGQQSSDLGRDPPGRSFESAGTTRHAIAPKHDLHAMEKQKFIRDLAELVNKAAAQGEFDELLLVAPAHALHDLREALDKPAMERLVGSLGKDLTKVPDHELGEHLAEWAQPPGA